MAEDIKAKEIINEFSREEARQANIRSLWQDASDYIYPYVDITALRTPGEARTDKIYDMTPMLDMLDMVSGLKQVLIPVGQSFFAVKLINSENNRNDAIQRYLSLVTEQAHEEIFSSNFITEFDEVLRSLIVFGPGSIYSEWTKKTGLNYRASTVGSYILIEDSTKNVVGKLEKISLTAQQAYEEFGNKAGEEVVKALGEPNKSGECYDFIHKIAPRKNRNPDLKDNLNKPYESIIVNVKEKVVVSEGGYEENPCHTARWMRPANEKDGRGVGTEMLPQIKVLNQMVKDLIECGNKHNNPPREVLDSVEGAIRVTPGAINRVQAMNSIRSLDERLNGNFPITVEMVQMQTEVIHRAFFRQVFAPLADLTGDRRTTLEIQERIRQELQRLGPPVGRVQAELMTKLIQRSILLLIRNRVLPQPPEELQGANFGIEYVGPFALALRSQQAKGFQEWVSFVAQMDAVFPGAKENVDADDAVVRMGRTFGVNVEDIATEEERNQKRQLRAQQEQAMQAMQVAQLASKGYNDMKDAPQEGSGTQKMMDAVGAK